MHRDPAGDDCLEPQGFPHPGHRREAPGGNPYPPGSGGFHPIDPAFAGDPPPTFGARAQRFLSDDPGRYLCNQVFFTTLEFLGKNALRIPAGFIHLPLETVCPTRDAARAISEVIRLVSDEVNGYDF